MFETLAASAASKFASSFGGSLGSALGGGSDTLVSGAPVTNMVSYDGSGWTVATAGGSATGARTYSGTGAAALGAIVGSPVGLVALAVAGLLLIKRLRK